MAHLKKYFLFALIFSTCFACDKPEEPIEEVDLNSLDDGILKILFIGNSHTYYNSLPTTVSNLLKTKITDEEILVMSSTGGGLGLEDHANLESTNTSIASENWDYVVLQENGAFATYPLAEAQERIYPFARDLQKKIKDNHEDTKIVLYLTHGYKNGGSWCDDNPLVCTYELMQIEIRRNYLKLEELIEAEIAPAGMMWWFIKNDIEIDLWDVDEFHPNPLGSYISAITIAAHFTQEFVTDEDLAASEFSPEDAVKVKQIINSALFSNFPDWRTFQ